MPAAVASATSTANPMSDTGRLNGGRCAPQRHGHFNAFGE